MSDQPIRRPCLACKQSKVKCTYTSPCLRCVKRSIPCVPPPDASDGRLRKYHRRSTLGCLCCKARHVRCDERRPVCGNCLVRVEECIYPPTSSSSSTSHPSTPPSSSTRNPQQQHQRLHPHRPQSSSSSRSRTRSISPIDTREVGRTGLDLGSGGGGGVDFNGNTDRSQVLEGMRNNSGARTPGPGGPMIGSSTATAIDMRRTGRPLGLPPRRGGGDGESIEEMMEGPMMLGGYDPSPLRRSYHHSQRYHPSPPAAQSALSSGLANPNETTQNALVVRRGSGVGVGMDFGLGQSVNRLTSGPGLDSFARQGFDLGIGYRMDEARSQSVDRGYEGRQMNLNVGGVGRGWGDGPGHTRGQDHHLNAQESQTSSIRGVQDHGLGSMNMSYPSGSGTSSGGDGVPAGGGGTTEGGFPAHRHHQQQHQQQSSLVSVSSGFGGMAPMSMARNDIGGRWVGGPNAVQGNQGSDGLAGMEVALATTNWQPEGSRFVLVDGENALDPHLQQVTTSHSSNQAGGYTVANGPEDSPSTSSSLISTFQRDSSETSVIPTAPVLPILSRNLFPNRRNPPQEPLFHVPADLSAFAAASPGVQRASHQAWIKSLWMNAAMTRTPKMVMTVDVDNLEGFFPNTEQRHQFKHFTSQTCDIILTIPTSATGNPWLNLFVPLALSFPHGTSLTCDALRLGILSIATFDIGFRMSRLKGEKEEGAKEEDNAMYQLSRLQRAKALELLKIAKIAGQLDPDKADSVEMDMTLGATLMLSIRDRLSGSTEWKDPMDLAVRLVLSMGGPNTFLSKRFSKERQFILEQTICVEIIACLTILTPTRLLGRDQAWFLSPRQVEDMEQDHIELVYGLDRETLAYIAEGLYLSDIKRSVEILRYKAKEMREYPEFHTALLARESEMQAFGNLLLDRVGVLRMSTLMTPHATRVAVGNLLFQALMELWVIAEITDDVVHDPRLQTAVDNIFEIVTEAMTRGMFSGFLLPCSWAASFASTPESRLRSTRILSLLKPGYHLDHDLMTRMIRTLWTKFDMASGYSFVNVGPASGKSLMMGKEEGGQLMDYEAWEKFMKEEGLYVPIF